MAVTGSRSAVLTTPTDTQILVTRGFAAPKHLVYEAWTKPELIKKWWHANRGEVTVAEVDLRVGGKWRYVSRTPDGIEVGFHGEYREIVPNERIVSTEVFEGIPGMEVDLAEAEANATVNILTLVEEDGRTTLSILIEAPSKDVRDAIISSGMEDGLQDALGLLEEVAASLA